jgi:hypothetical protein
MRPGLSGDWTTALASQGITTAIMAVFQFASGDVAIWTGAHPIQVTGSGDQLLDGVTFDPIVNGLMIGIGDNTFSFTGSEALTLTLAIPQTPTPAMLNSSISATEYQSRLAVLWRCLMVTPAGATTPAIWTFSRVRAGSMDELTIKNDGVQHTFEMTIEAHAAMVTAATNSSYLDQPKFDATDTSQAFAVSIANNPTAPAPAPVIANYNSGYGNYAF